MSSGKVTRYENNVRIDGYLDLSNSTSGYIRLPALSSAPSTPAVGMQYYDTTLGLIRMYQASGWSNINGTAAGSIDAAYNGGGTITVDAGAVTLNDSQADTTGALLITKSGVVAGSDSASIFKINSTGAHSTSGRVSLVHLVMGTETSTTPEGIRVTMNDALDNALKITVGAVTLDSGSMTLSSGSLTLSSGNLSVTGTASVSGTSTLAAINNSGTITSQGVMIIDIDNAEALLIRRNGDAADLITVDSTQDAGDILLTIAPQTTSGKGIFLDLDTTTGQGLDIDASTVTTGDALRIKVISGTMTAAGSAISVIDNATEIFAVRDDGSIYSKATAEGTTAFQIVTGDLVITDGDLTLSGGEVAVTDGITTTGSGLALVTSITTSTAGAFVVTGNSLTSGTLALLTTSGTVAGNGKVLSLVAASLTTGTVLDFGTTAALTTGIGLKMAHTTGAIADTGSLVRISSSSVDTGGATNGVLLDLKSTGQLAGTLVRLDTIATTGTAMSIISTGIMTTTGNLLTLTANSATTAAGLLRVNGNGLTSGIGVVITSSATAMTGAGRLLRVDHTGVTGSTAILSEFASAANDETVIVKITASDVNALGTALVVSTATTTGNGISVTANALTDGFGINVQSSATATTSTGRLFRVSHSGVTSTSGILAEVASAANDETVVMRISASDVLALGNVLDLVGAAVTTGTILDMGGLNALTTGTALNITSDSSSNGTRSLVSIVNDNTGATGTTPVLIQNDATAGAHIKLTGTGILGIDFTALTVADCLFNATAGQGCSAAPQTNAAVGFLNIKVAGTSQWIPYYDAT